MMFPIRRNEKKGNKLMLLDFNAYTRSKQIETQGGFKFEILPIW